MTRGLPEVSGARLKRALERAGFVEVHTRQAQISPDELRALL